MLPEQAAHLDLLLSEWHRCTCGRSSKGFTSKSAGFESWHCSRQYDDQNGALDTDLDHRQVSAVNFAAEQMTDPHKAAIYADARNLCLGISVWSSPRLPPEPAMREAIVREARIMMCNKLISAGVM